MRSGSRTYSGPIAAIRRESVIEVTRLDGSVLYVNADHIRAAEANPDTVITFTDGKRLVVLESPAEVAAKVIRYRWQVSRSSECLAEA